MTDWTPDAITSGVATLPDGTTCTPDPERARCLRDRYALRAWQPDELHALSDKELCLAQRLYYPDARDNTTAEIATFSAMVAEELRRAAASRDPKTPPRYGTHDLDTMDPRHGQRSAHMDLCDIVDEGEEQIGAYLYGDSGTGKSHLASAWVRSMTAAGWKARMVSWPELLEQVRREMSGGESSDLITVAMDTPAVVLDDLGVLGMSDYRADVAHTVIDRRCLHRMPTVITSNLDPGQLRAVTGERMVTRLRELCPSVRVER